MSTSPLGHIDPLPEPEELKKLEASKRLCSALRCAADALSRAYDQADEALWSQTSLEYVYAQLERSIGYMGAAHVILTASLAHDDPLRMTLADVSIEDARNTASRKGGA